MWGLSALSRAPKLIIEPLSKISLNYWELFWKNCQNSIGLPIYD
jgi:hypothetical protein